MKQGYKTLYIVIMLTCMASLKALAIDDDGMLLDDVPIDGGLSLLLAAGLGYGIKKIHIRKKDDIRRDD